LRRHRTTVRMINAAQLQFPFLFFFWPSPRLPLAFKQIFVVAKILATAMQWIGA